MRSSTYIAMFAVSAVAQESATVINLFQFRSTLTVLGSDASATTYKISCPSDSAGLSVMPTELRPTPSDPNETLFLTPAPATTANPLQRRQKCTSEGDDYYFCEPYTLIQGASTYEFHLTDLTLGAWTMDMACNWQGPLTTADLTCTVTQAGYVPDSSDVGTATSVWKQSDIQDLEAYQTVALVSGTGASSGLPSVSASRTPSGSGTGVATPTRSGSGSNSAAQSTGLAAARPMPTHGMALVGGAVGIFAAALAL
ncbi:Nn.00g100910.m01.CDS01 [Neocucurbitaria sp. VM-36]